MLDLLIILSIISIFGGLGAMVYFSIKNKELFDVIDQMKRNEAEYVEQLEEADRKIDELEHDLADAEECCAVTEREYSRSSNESIL